MRAFFFLLAGCVGVSISILTSARAGSPDPTTRPTTRASLPLTEIRAAAESGDVEAQLELARRYTEGIETKADLESAVAWLRRAADAGDARGKTRLGVAYLYGRGVARDGREGAKLVRAAAESGDAVAQDILASLYHKGLFAPQDDKEAFRWYFAAAQQD